MEIKLPTHLGIIMDGNGRWAQARGRGRIFGHVKGARTAKKIIEECARRKIKYLTMYAFSTENWQRPRAEVSFLMTLLKRHFDREQKQLLANNIRFSYIGELESLPGPTREIVLDTVQKTSKNDGMRLIFALSYGGRQEITATVRKIAEKVRQGEISTNDINEEFFSKHLETADIPDPDLIVRTSGEYRLSNFMLWQSAYSEIYVCDTFWPDFGVQNLNTAFEFFSSRDRRYGKTESQLKIKRQVQKPFKLQNLAHL